MVVGAARHDAEARLRERSGERGRVRAYLLRVDLELWRRRLLQHHGLARDDVHQRAALDVGEHRTVDRLPELGVAEDHAAAGPAECLVRGRRDDLRMPHRCRVLAGRDETGEVRHIDDEERADLIGDPPKAREIEKARIRGRPGNDHLGSVLLRQPLDLVVVDQLVLAADVIRHDLVQLRGEVHRRAMREVSTLVEREAEHGVARLHHRGVRRHVRLCARMGLHVDRGRAEQRLGALDRERLGNVDPLAATVIATARVALRVLVREHAADRFHHRGARVVLGGDELDLLDLSPPLAFDRRVQLGIFAL